MPQDLDGVRKQPSVATALIVFIGYLAVIIGVNLVTARHFDFGDVAATANNTRDGVVFPVLAASIYLTVVTTLLGWWKPALRDSSAMRSAPKWMWALPVLSIIVCIANLTRSEHRSEFTNTHWTWIIVGFALVGYSEELMTRGLLVTGFRSKFGEMKVMYLTALLFGVMHGLNIVFGQSAGTTLAQMIGTIPMGIVFYMLRRSTGTILVPMVIHAVWDISVVVFGGTESTLNELDSEAPKPATLAIVILLCFVAWVVHRKRLFDPAQADG
jgi:membrane protease YdiL (CAAX protease family)